jgi:hypothetical protein
MSGAAQSQFPQPFSSKFTMKSFSFIYGLFYDHIPPNGSATGKRIGKDLEGTEHYVFAILYRHIKGYSNRAAPAYMSTALPLHHLLLPTCPSNDVLP